MPLLSIIIPAYNEAENVPEAASTISALMTEAGIAHEIIFVDDGSTDNTWGAIEKAAETSGHVSGIKLSRNFGKEGAILAGLSHAAGECVALIDCDLQHPPGVLPEMYSIWKQGGVDIVEGVKQSRGKEPVIYKGFSKLFYSAIERMGGIRLKDSSDFQLLDRRVVDIIVSLPERQRFFRALSSWVGFNKVQVPFVVNPRKLGKSKFNFFKSLKYAVANITSFSSSPMNIVTVIGFLFFIAALALGIQTLYNWIIYRAVEGFTTVILLLLIVGSVLMFSVGVIGVYISKIYEEIKNRPSYIVDKAIWADGRKDEQE